MNMNLKIKAILLCVTVSLLSACSWCGSPSTWVRDRGQDFNETCEYPPIMIPVGIKTEGMSQEYKIP